MTQIFIDTYVLTSVTLIRLDISRFIKRIFVSEFLFYLASDKNTLFEAYLVIVDTSCEFLSLDWVKIFCPTQLTYRKS